VAGCTSRGSPLVIGSVLAATGLIGQDVGSAKPTLAVWAKYVNDHFGGVACHPVQVYSVDDSSDPGRSASAVNDLVVNKHAKALVGNFVPISISGFRSALDQVKVPAIGGDLFTLDWDQDPLMYPVGTVVDANAYGSMQSLAAAGHNKVAVLYCVEAPVCPAYKDAVVQNAPKAGASVATNPTSVSITQTDYTSVCQSAKSAGATQMAMIVDGAAVGRLARSCQTIGYNVPFAVASLGATFDRNDPNVRAMTVTVASAAVPWFRSDNAAESEFQSAMKAYAPSLPLDPTTIVAWSDGMMLKAAIDKLGPAARSTDITTDMIFQGLTKIQNETLGGLIAPQSYSPTRGPNPPNMCYFPAKFDGSGTWQAPLGTSYACLK
jgi:branched-chain amino acid transport system substrate-binding protein